MSSIGSRAQAMNANVPNATATVRVVGGAVIRGERKAVTLSTSRLVRFRVRHPFLYGLIAFVAGGGIVSLFTMSTYTNWAYQSIDLKVALYQVVFGGLGGGIALLVLAFLYAADIRQTLRRNTQ